MSHILEMKNLAQSIDPLVEILCFVHVYHMLQVPYHTCSTMKEEQITQELSFATNPKLASIALVIINHLRYVQLVLVIVN